MGFRPRLHGKNTMIADKPGFIPVNRPLLDGNERRYLNECIDTGWISSEGAFVKRFEELFAECCRQRFGVAVTNGTTALEIAVRALGIGPGDEVILPAFTIISCAQAVISVGATPVLVDCDPITWNMLPHQVAERITPRTRAIMPVHIFGLPVDMKPIMKLAEKHGLYVIEDNAESIGQSCYGHPCGGFGHVSATSFYANKHVTTGEGGMVLTSDPDIADRLRSLRNLCFEDPRFVHRQLGWNMRMTNIQAAVGLAQLERLDQFIHVKRQMGQYYTQELQDLPWISLPLEKTDFAENVYWVYGIVLSGDVPFDARTAMEKLRRVGIDSRPFFWPMHKQPVFHDMGLFTGEYYPTSENIAQRGFYPPSGLGLSKVEQQRVILELRRILSPPWPD